MLKYVGNESKLVYKSWYKNQPSKFLSLSSLPLIFYTSDDAPYTFGLRLLNICEFYTFYLALVVAEKEMMRPKSDSVALQIMCVNVNIFQDNIKNNFNFIPLIDLCMIFNPYIKLRKVHWRCRWVGVTWKILQFREDEIYHTLEDDNKDHFTHNSGLSFCFCCCWVYRAVKAIAT